MTRLLQTIILLILVPYLVTIVLCDSKSSAAKYAEFQGQNILVTGGTAGIGYATALQFALNGANVAIFARDSRPDWFNGTTAVKNIKEATQNKVKVIFVRVNIAKAEEVKRGVKQVVSELGGIDICVNAAGIGGPMGYKIDQIPEEYMFGYHDPIFNNLYGTMNMMRAVISHWRSAKISTKIEKVIVNLSSFNGQRACEECSMYSASKHGIIGITQSAAMEYAMPSTDLPRIRVNALCPGLIDTPLTRNQAKFLENGTQIWEGPLITETSPLWLKYKPTFEKELVGQRIGRPEEMANVILFLSSDASSYMTGQSINADFGLIASPPWLQVAENYLNERIFCNILATINPDNCINENDLTVQLPDFIYSHPCFSDSELKQGRHTSSMTSGGGGARTSRRSSPSSSMSRSSSTSALKSARGDNKDRDDNISIDELIERDIEKERRRIRNLSQQIKRNSLLGRNHNYTLPKTIATTTTTTRTTLLTDDLKPANRARRKKNSDFVFTNPHNVHIPSEYDYILFDDMETQKKTTRRMVSNMTRTEQEQDEEEAMYDEVASNQNMDTSTHYIPTSSFSTTEDYQQFEQQQQQQPRLRTKYQSSVYRDVFKPKIVQVKSESKDNMKKILLNQFELTAALHNQLSELNKKKKKSSTSSSGMMKKCNMKK